MPGRAMTSFAFCVLRKCERLKRIGICGSWRKRPASSICSKRLILKKVELRKALDLTSDAAREYAEENTFDALIDLVRTDDAFVKKHPKRCQQKGARDDPDTPFKLSLTPLLPRGGG